MTEQKCVLIVSSDPDLLQALTFALVVERFSVNSATSWDQALSVCSRTPPAVIIHDVRSMEKSLRSRLWEFRNVHPEVPVLLLSSLDSPELCEAERAGLITASFVKPPRLEALEECLARLGVGHQPRETASPTAYPVSDVSDAIGGYLPVCISLGAQLSS